MKAKKDGKLTTSPDPFAVDDLSATKLSGIPEYMDPIQRLPGQGDYTSYHMNAPLTNVSPHVAPTMPHNYMMPPYEGIKPYEP